MLANLLIQQPQMLGAIIQNTPYWVWALLAGLIALGASQLVGRNVSLARATAMPLAMTGLSVYGLVSAFGSAGQVGTSVGAWLVAACAIAPVIGMASMLNSTAKQAIQANASRCRDMVTSGYGVIRRRI